MAIRNLPTAAVLSLLYSCGGGGGDGSSQSASALGGGAPAKPVRSCADGGLCLVIDGKERGADEYLNPVLKITGIGTLGGTGRLFSDPSCTIYASAKTDLADTSELSIKADRVVKMKTRLWGRYVYPDNELSSCLGPVTVNLEDRVRLELTQTRSEGDLTPSFWINSLFPEEAGTAQLFADSACTQTASDPVPNHSTVEAYELEGDGDYRFWIKIGYENGGTSRCFGETLYSTEESMTLSHPTGKGNDTNPTFSVGGLTSGQGTVQLFGDSSCTAVASGTVVVDGTIEEVTANRLSRYANNFYARHTVDGNGGPCLGPVSYQYDFGFDDHGRNPTTAAPIFEVWGFLAWDGTVGLFSDPSCTAAVSDAVTVEKGTRVRGIGQYSIAVKANRLSKYTNNFYAKHTVDGNESGCAGPVSHPNDPYLRIHSSSVSAAAPVFTVEGLLGGGGAVRLYSDADCSSAASDEVTAVGAAVQVSANARTSEGPYSFYAKHTVDGGESRCVGPAKTMSMW